MCQSCDTLNNVVLTARSNKLDEIERYCNNVKIHILDVLSRIFNDPEFKIDWADKDLVRTLKNIKVVLKVKKTEAESHLESLKTLNDQLDELDEEAIPTVSIESNVENIIDQLEDWIETFQLSLNSHKEVDELVDTLEKYSKVIKNNISK